MISTTASPAPASDELPETKVQQIIDRVRELRRKSLGKASEARGAFADYGLIDQSILDRHSAGFVDGSLPRLLPADPTLRGQLVRLGVLDEQGNECFVGSVVFPIDSADGRRVNLWMCGKDGASHFLLGRPIALWNAIAAKHSAHLYVFTDPIEALSAVASDIANVVALDSEQGQPDHTAISGWGVQRLTIVVPDTPEGAKQGEQIEKRMQPLKSSMVKLPGCQTINELFRTKGAKALAAAIMNATQGLEVIAIRGMEPRADGFDYEIGSGRRYRVRGIAHGPQKLTVIVSREVGEKIHLDKVDMLSARSRKELAREIARIFREPADLAEADVIKLLAACERRIAMPNPGGGPSPAPGTIPEADRKLGEAFGRDPNLVALILADYEQFKLVGERANKLLSYLTMSSRKLRRPLAVLTVSSSGSGKSALQEVTVLFCPPEDVEKITNLSSKALYHKEKDSLKSKLVAFEEAEGVKKADYPLRALMSSGELRTEVAIKDSVTGKLTTMTNTVEGPIAVLLTTTSLALNAETISRFFVTSINDSREQTRAIQEIQRRDETLEGLAAEQGQAEILRRHHAFQRLLQPLRVLNPLINEVEFNDDRVSARRELPKRLRLIQAIAFLRQLQKPVKYLGGTAYVEVDQVDLRIARELSAELFSHSVAELSPMAHGLLLQLAKMAAETRRASPSENPPEPEPFTFTARLVREYTGSPNSSLQRHLRELCEFEYVVRESGRQGRTCRYRLDWEASGVVAPLEGKSPQLPTVSR